MLIKYCLCTASHIVVKFSVKDSRGNIAGITKILGVIIIVAV